MIVTELYDGQGLGNQLWCYVVTRVIALDRGADFGIMHPERFKGAGFLDLDFGRPVVGGTGPAGGPPWSLPRDIRWYYREEARYHPDGADIRALDPRLAAVPDGTKIDGLMQDERYVAHRKDEIRAWLKPAAGHAPPGAGDPDVCVINFRGGEYVRFPEVFLSEKYWSDAIARMRQEVPGMRFVVVTDDERTARSFFPDFTVSTAGPDGDYRAIAEARYLILSNSSFAWFPAWLNNNAQLVIAPKYWARHNVSDGYWSTGGAITAGWTYLDRDGVFSDAAACEREYAEYKTRHPEIFGEPKISDNFLLVSNYRNDISWVPSFARDYLVCDQSPEPILPPDIDPEKVRVTPHLGHNIRDYCEYIVSTYDSLPERVILCAGNVFPRHVSQRRFIETMNASSLTPIFEPERHAPVRPIARIEDGLYAEYNDSWYLKHHPTRYFHSYDDFMRFAFEDAPQQPYIRFVPGANMVVPREAIRKYPKPFYENLRMFVSHTGAAIPGESHILERALWTIWSEDLRPTPEICAPIAAAWTGVPRSSVPLAKRIKRAYYAAIGKTAALARQARAAARKLPSLMQYFNGQRDIGTLWTRPEMAVIARLRDRSIALARKLRKFRDRRATIKKGRAWLRALKQRWEHEAAPERLRAALAFPLLDSDALQRMCDYSFGDHSGVLGRVPGAFMKKANASNGEFAAAVRSHTGAVMTLFVDNVRLYHRDLPFRDWLHAKPVTPADKAWLETLADQDLLALCASFPEKNFVIFTALEDNGLDESIAARIPKNVLAIHAANAVFFGGTVHPYPHGLERRMYRGHNHQDILRYFLLDERTPSNLLYVNHRNDTGARGSLYGMFSGKPWATVSPRVDYGTYLSGIKDHMFVLCPSGNGIESARNWETLYMRRVPIFKRHPYLEEMFKDFPALFVDDYAEVTEELLRANEHLYRAAQETDMTRLNLDAVFASRVQPYARP